jgi:signal peptidase I
MTRSPSRSDDAFDIIRTVLIALAVALAVRVLLFQPYTIPSASMEPNLLVGDYVVITKFDYGWSRWSVPLGLPLFEGRVFGRSAERGDVAVFKKPGAEGEAVIKRVIGLPGDRIRLSGGVVSVNGREIARTPGAASLDEDSGLPVARFDETLGERRYAVFDQGPGRPGDDTGVYVVPAGRYFVMGDNRDNSADSRWPAGVGMGFVPAENLVGRARFILASWKPGASLFKPWTWFSLRPGRLVSGLA